MKDKTVVYIDLDDEITGIIDKVNTSKNKLIALVLPKRATVFQSIVNLRLLKRTAETSKKKIVLVTSEAAILPIAGAVGLHVAKNLQSAPYIPEPPDISGEPLAVAEGADDNKDKEDKEVDPDKPVGVLAGLTPRPIPKAADEDEAIELNNDEKSTKEHMAELTGGIAGAAKDKAKAIKSKGGKHIKVPNFEKFRLFLILGIALLVVLIIGIVIAAKVLPKATVTIKTNTSGINSSQTITLSSAAKSLDPVNLIAPAQVAQIQKTVTSPQVNTTGQKTTGAFATGTITITNDCINSSPQDVPPGTVFTDSSGNFNFASTSDATVPGSAATIVKGKLQCSQPSVSVPVSAAQIGSSYNIGATAYSSQDSNLSGYSMQGSDMSGGSSQQVQVVAQADISNAEGQISAPSSSSIKQQLQQQLQKDGLYAVVGSFVANPPNDNPSADVDSTANTITVTATYTYTMYGTQTSNLNTLIDNSVDQQINTSKQSILDNGLSKAQVTYLSSASNSVQINLQITATVGAKLNATSLKKEVVGEKSGTIVGQINSLPGVTNVSVHYSPFWVDSVPNNVNKVKIVIEKSNGSTP